MQSFSGSMANEYQMDIDDLSLLDYQHNLKKRIAYIDECGSYGFDFSKDNVSKYYVLCAIIVEQGQLEKLHKDFNLVKHSSGYIDGAELKSSKIKENTRLLIMSKILPLKFNIVLFIANKEKFKKNSPITNYKPVFIKYLDQHLYNLLYKTYPRLSIIQDEIGNSEFKKTFVEYVENNRPEYNLFNQYDFNFVNSKDEELVQLADFIGGSISKHLTDPKCTNYMEMLSGKIAAIEYFPCEHEPYWGNVKPEDCHYNEKIYGLALKTVRDFIDKYSEDDNAYRKMQVAVLRYLLMYVLQIDPTAYVYSDALVDYLRENVGLKVVRNTLFRRVIAPLRDEGVILASCSRGYKIPISIYDLMAYLNQSLTTIGPMINRMGICRQLVKQGTDGELDLFNDPALVAFKRYFDEIT